VIERATPFLGEPGSRDARRVGAKAATLGRLALRHRIPAGFCLDIAVFERFVTKDKKSLIIGPTLSNAAKQTDPVAQEGKTPVLAVSNTAAGITEIGDYIFRDSLTEGAVIPQTVAAPKQSCAVSLVPSPGQPYLRWRSAPAVRATPPPPGAVAAPAP